MVKIALLVESNPVWLLETIEETINILEKEGYEILGNFKNLNFLKFRLIKIKIKKFYLYFIYFFLLIRKFPLELALV